MNKEETNEIVWNFEVNGRNYVIKEFTLKYYTIYFNDEKIVEITYSPDGEHYFYDFENSELNEKHAGIDLIENYPSLNSYIHFVLSLIPA